MFSLVYRGLKNHQQIEAFQPVKWFKMGAYLPE
jgi:hypothetical protein